MLFRSIVNVASGVGWPRWLTTPGRDEFPVRSVPYATSKAAVIALTRVSAMELGPLGIRVNCICPVAGETGMLADFMGGDTPENRARFVASVPLGRLSTPSDIADAALYLCSDQSAFITGVALEVDGGRCI